VLRLGHNDTTQTRHREVREQVCDELAQEAGGNWAQNTKQDVLKAESCSHHQVERWNGSRAGRRLKGMVVVYCSLVRYMTMESVYQVTSHCSSMTSVKRKTVRARDLAGSVMGSSRWPTVSLSQPVTMSRACRAICLVQTPLLSLSG
jgi:hypothetical protein